MVSDQSWATLVLVVETIIIVMITVAVIEARRLRIHRHRLLIVSAYLLQGTTFALWMLPRFLRSYDFFINNTDQFWPRFLHAGLGLLIALLATGLIIAMYIEPEIHVAKMKRGKPLMRTVYTLWVLNFLIGVYTYQDIHLS